MPPPPPSLVRPPDPAREGRRVALAAAVILHGTLLGASLRAPPAPGAGAPRVLAETGDLGPAGARVAADLAAAVEDLGMGYAAGTWPEPAALAAEGVPPFDEVPPFTRVVDGPLARYRRGPPGRGWLLEVAEAAPAARDPTHGGVPDPRDHRALPGGGVVHFKLYTHPDPRPGPAPASPVMAGWRRVEAEVWR